MMISKWVVTQVTRRNPSLVEFIEGYGNLNLESVIQGRNAEDGVALGLDWADYLLSQANVCN